MSKFGGVFIPQWVWCAIKADAKSVNKSEHWVIKLALKQYLAAKGYNAKQFERRDEDSVGEW